MRVKYLFCLVFSIVALAAGCGDKALPPEPEGAGDLRDDIANAILSGDTATVTQLLTTEPLLLNEPHPLSGQTPIHVAATTGNSEMISLLLDQGADTSMRDDEGQSPGDIAAAAGASPEVVARMQAGQ